MPNFTKPSIVVFRQSLQSGRHPQCVLALILNKQEIDTQTNCNFPSNKWSETCTTTLILLISVSFQRIGGGGRFVNIYHRQLQNLGYDHKTVNKSLAWPYHQCYNVLRINWHLSIIYMNIHKLCRTLR